MTRIPKRVRIELVYDQKTADFEYSKFNVGDEASGYKLTLGLQISGNIIDNNLSQFSLSNGMRFQTFDKNPYANCPQNDKTGWWFNVNGCSCSNTYCATCGCTTFCPLCNDIRTKGVVWNEARIYIQ